MRQVQQGTYPLMSITMQLSGPFLSSGYSLARSLQTYVSENRAAKIGDIAAGYLSFEVR